MMNTTNRIFSQAFIFAGLLIVFCHPLFAQQRYDGTHTVTVGGTELISLPFAAESFLVARPDVATAMKLTDERKIQISGLAPGSTDLTVVGDGQTNVFKINVVQDVRATYLALTRDLDTVPEVHLSVNGPRVVIRGEVHDIDNWNLLRKVVAVYGTDVLNLATFRPAPEVTRQLHESLRKAGFRLVDQDEEVEPGEVRLRFSGNSLFIRALFLTSSDVEKLKRVVESHRWIQVSKSSENEDEVEGKVRAVIDAEVLPSMLDVEVAFVGLSDTEQEQFGVNLFKAGMLTLNTASLAFQGEINGPSGFVDGGNYTISTGLGGTLNFLSSSGPGRFIRRGHISFRNDEPGWKTFQDGGTIKVRVASENAVGLEDIDYGLILRVRGELADLENVDLDLDVELSSPLLQRNGDYNVVSQNVSTAVQCRLDHTMVISGVDSLSEAIERTGVPVLRDIPVLKYLFSENGKTVENRNVLILVSPRMAVAPRRAEAISLAESNLEAEAKARLPLEYKPEPEAEPVKVEFPE